MKTIPLTRGKIALVDDDLYGHLSRWKWCAVKQHRVWYAIRAITVAPRKRVFLGMHRIVMGASRSQRVDHRDGNGLNNQRENLRFADCSNNAANLRIIATNTSGFKGVSYSSANRKWEAQVKVHKRSVHLGRFEAIEDAARAYDLAAIEHFGEFALTNKMMGLL